MTGRWKQLIPGGGFSMRMVKIALDIMGACGTAATDHARTQRLNHTVMPSSPTSMSCSVSSVAYVVRLTHAKNSMACGAARYTAGLLHKSLVK